MEQSTPPRPAGATATALTTRTSAPGSRAVLAAPRSKHWLGSIRGLRKILQHARLEITQRNFKNSQSVWMRVWHFQRTENITLLFFHTAQICTHTLPPHTVTSWILVGTAWTPSKSLPKKYLKFFILKIQLQIFYLPINTSGNRI